ncbi:MAG: hypothetical protein NTW97_01380 [Candidatus Krumholzibacteria bacterium]|nr:hypothetical protein [Candidatus Krumholzibacteria bacterium]
MNSKIGTRLLFGATLAILVAVFGCSEDTMIGAGTANKSPEVWLSSGPVEGTTTGYQVHFYWGGWDPDGEIRCFEYVVVDGYPLGFHREDTTGLDKWRKSSSFDSIFKVSADDSAKEVDYGNYAYTHYSKTHTFFIRAVDLEGKRSDPVYRSFTAWTLAPFIEITMPRPPSNRNQTVSLGKVIKWEWRGTDPIDSPENTQDPDSIRYLYHQLITPSGNDSSEFDIILDLNEHPWRYEGDWSPWISYRAPGDSGRSTWLGDDEILTLTKAHIFAVQAKDEAGAVTAIFTRGVNVRQFIVSVTAFPFLTITEPYLGGFRFTGTNLRAEKRDLPPGVPLNFRFLGDASEYGGEIVCFQYGWDVADLNNPSDWGSDCSPFNRGCTAIWYSGVHTLFVRCVDNSGSETLGLIEINIVPFTMDRNLLWVDDFPSSNFSQQDYAMPREDEHDAFWVALCRRASGFDPTRDVYDAASGGSNFSPPKISLIGRYKNIVWSYSSDLTSICWDDIVRFTLESQIETGSQLVVNYLSIFLAKGGHLLTEGRSDRTGGFAAMLQSNAMVFPLNLRCEITGPREGCEGDTSGVYSMGYRDYCITMLDKVTGTFRSDPDMRMRREQLDALEFAVRDDADSFTADMPGLPATLTLWEEVTKTDRYFDPRKRGFNYVEIYDPQYWMNQKQAKSQGCFHPMYRMRSRNVVSPVNNTAIALVVTKYAGIVPDVGFGPAVAAPSAHFGFELWFFNRAQVNALIDVIFEKWGIKAG